MRLKYKIFSIFAVPILALIYFSYQSIQTEYNQLKKAKIYKFSAMVTDILSDLIHQIQRERGLSAGYIAVKSSVSYEKKLKKQFLNTDKAYIKLKSLVKHSSDQKTELLKILSPSIERNVDVFMKKFLNIRDIRKKTLLDCISFEDEIHYYSSLNKLLIKMIEQIGKPFSHLQDDSEVISFLEKIKECAGIERAHIYHILLSNDFDEKQLERLKILKIKQDEFKNNFFYFALNKSLKIYNDLFSEEIERELNACRKGVLSHSFNADKADYCFDVSTAYIDHYKHISEKILNHFEKNTQQIYKNSLHSLIVIHILWALSFFALLLLALLLKRLLNNEHKNIEELRIASYAFEAQEAMTVTDIEGNIIKINKAFTDITGYEASEAIGKNTNILKSNIQGFEFYNEMWNTLLKEGKWQGEIYNKRKSGEIYPEFLSVTAIKNENGETTNYIAQFLDISEIKKAQEHAEYQADHDFLTGLLNRKSLMSSLQQEFEKAKNDDTLDAFLFIDLDHFKKINDSYGHHIGDQMLIEIAKRIKQVIGKKNIVARISGDEFGVVLQNLDNSEKKAALLVKNICQNLLKEISSAYIIGNLKLYMSTSIGVKLFPEDEKSINDIIYHADKAMYEAKKQGKNKFVFFDKQIATELKEFAILESEIKSSLEHDDFVFFYQPKVNVKTGEIKGAELLVRWMHPEKGLLYPSDFLLVVENIGLIHQLFILALHQACKFLQKQKVDFDGTLSLNITAEELLNSDFEQEVESIISEYNIPAGHIELEITESIIIKEFDLIVTKIKRLQTIGVKFSIDDFGTGYSSITYLQKLPVDTLKIDKSFFMNLDKQSNQELVKMVINIAKTFHMQIVAEGIEEEDQLIFIEGLGADLYQGYYFKNAIEERVYEELLYAQRNDNGVFKK